MYANPSHTPGISDLINLDRGPAFLPGPAGNSHMLFLIENHWYLALKKITLTLLSKHKVEIKVRDIYVV